MNPVMSCSLRAPCGNQLTRMVEGPDFAVVECVNGHAFRIGAPPPPTTPGPRDVVATARSKPWDRHAHERDVIAQGRCVTCRRKRGLKGTKHHCRQCADARNRRSLRWWKKKGAARRRHATQATKDEHARQMAGIKKKERA